MTKQTATRRVKTLAAMEVAGMDEVIAKMKSFGFRLIDKEAPYGAGPKKYPMGAMSFFYSKNDVSVDMSLTLTGSKTRLDIEFRGDIFEIDAKGIQKRLAHVAEAAKATSQAEKYLTQFVGKTPIDKTTLE